MPEPMSAQELVQTREGTHGSFGENAKVTQAIKRIVRNSPCYEALNDTQKEAVDRIAMKLGRIVGGNPNVEDHWDDLGGYAELGKQGIIVHSVRPKN